MSAVQHVWDALDQCVHHGEKTSCFRPSPHVHTNFKAEFKNKNRNEQEADRILWLLGGLQKILQQLLLICIQLNVTAHSFLYSHLIVYIYSCV